MPSRIIGPNDEKQLMVNREFWLMVMLVFACMTGYLEYWMIELSDGEVNNKRFDIVSNLTYPVYLIAIYFGYQQENRSKWLLIIAFLVIFTGTLQ